MSRQKPEFESSADPEMRSREEIRPLARPLGAFGEGLPFEGVKITRNLVYRKVDDIELRLDVYRKADGQNSNDQTGKTKEGIELRPGIVYIHGGAWRVGDKSRFTYYCEWLASEGYVAMPINYRLSDIAKYPAQIEDCQAAVRWVRENAEAYGIDPKRLGVIGGSAGAHLCVLLALKRATGTEVQAVVSYYGPHDLNDDGGAQKPPLGLIGAGPDEKPDQWRDAKCTTHVGPGAPPMLLIHGDRDRSVPLTQSTKLLERLKAHGNDVELIVVRGADHGLKELEMEPGIHEIDARVLEFLHKHLKDA